MKKEIKNVCERCKVPWIQRKEGRPKRCPTCSSLLWDKLDTTYGDTKTRKERLSR